MNPNNNPPSTDIHEISFENNSYCRMSSRLFQKGLQAFDVGGSGDCFFRAISHQHYGTPELHVEIRKDSISVNYVEQNPELFIESSCDYSWKDNSHRMSMAGTWCNNIVIQAVSNQLNCIIHIIESRVSCPNGSTITPPPGPTKPMILFVGYLEDMHYISTIPQTANKNALKYLKAKLSESDKQHQNKLLRKRENYHHKRKLEQELRETKKSSVFINHSQIVKFHKKNIY